MMFPSKPKRIINIQNVSASTLLKKNQVIKKIHFSLTKEPVPTCLIEGIFICLKIPEFWGLNIFFFRGPDPRTMTPEYTVIVTKMTLRHHRQKSHDIQNWSYWGDWDLFQQIKMSRRTFKGYLKQTSTLRKSLIITTNWSTQKASCN